MEPDQAVQGDLLVSNTPKALFSSWVCIVMLVAYLQVELGEAAQGE